MCISLLHPKAEIMEIKQTAVPGQQLSKNVPSAMNSHEKIGEMIDAVLSMRSVSCQILNM
jgi:hypothetical protein